VRMRMKMYRIVADRGLPQTSVPKSAELLCWEGVNLKRFSTDGSF
jgi:hypothetical protein